MPKIFTQESLSNVKHYSLSIIFALVVIITGTAAGSVPVSFLHVINALINHSFGLHQKVSTTDDVIVWLIRFPRVMLAFLVGASLSMAGYALQGLLKNPLADPYTLGVSSGSSLGAVLVIFTGWSIPFIGIYTLPVVSIIFGGLTLLIILLISRAVNHVMTMEIVILAGIIISSFFASLVSLCIALSDKNLKNIVSWLLGSVAMRGWPYVGMMVPFIVVGGVILLMNQRELSIMAMGEDQAHYLGVSVKTKRLLILFAATCLTGVSVAVSGAIGFVGLVIPHILRHLTRNNHKHLLMLSFINGGAFLVLADLFSRLVIAPSELPVGVVTAMIGAPVFAIILIVRRRKGEW